MALYAPVLQNDSESVAAPSAPILSCDTATVEPVAHSVGRPRWYSGKGRPLRFLLVGGVATSTQLALLALLLRLGWSAVLANAAALLTSTQINFALNAVFTWGDRWDGTARLVAARWLRFMGAAAGTLLLNEACYALLRHLLPALLAAGVCSAAIALLNYLLGDRLIFSPRRSTDRFTHAAAH